MIDLGYEIKYGKHIAFKPKGKARFTRAKTIGEDYTKERLKERIAEREFIKTPTVEKRIGNVIDMNTNAKVKESKGYEYWATKHNLHTMAESVIYIREHGIKSVKQLDEYIQKAADERQNIQEKIKAIDKEMQKLSTTMEQVHTVKNTELATRNIRPIHLTRHFLKSTKLRLPYMKMLSLSLKILFQAPKFKGYFS